MESRSAPDSGRSSGAQFPGHLGRGAVDALGQPSKKALTLLAAGKINRCPFPDSFLTSTRVSLRIALKAGGHGDGLPREGDVVQVMEVRLAQALRFSGPGRLLLRVVGNWSLVGLGQAQAPSLSFPL